MFIDEDCVDSRSDVDDLRTRDCLYGESRQVHRVWHAVMHAESYSNPAAIQWWHNRRSVQHHEAKSSEAVARPGDKNYKPWMSLSLECRVYHQRVESSVTPRTFRWSDIFMSDPATAALVGQPGLGRRWRVPNKQRQSWLGWGGARYARASVADCWGTRSAVWGRLQCIKTWCKCWYRLRTGGIPVWLISLLTGATYAVTSTGPVQILVEHQSRL